MSSWPLYVFYILLLASPLLFFVATKPGYEKVSQPCQQDKKTKATFKHSAKPSAPQDEEPVGDLLTAPTPPDTAPRSG